MKDYEKYSSKSKEERRKEAPENLEHKRFKLSPNPELKERLRNLRDVLNTIQESHPEVISFGLFGSMVKGYATNESDIDLYVNVDTDKWKRRTKSNKEYYQVPNFHKSYEKIVREELKKQLDLTDSQVKDIKINLISKKDIRDSSSRGKALSHWRIFLMSVGSSMKSYRKKVFEGIDLYAKNNPEFGSPDEEELVEILDYEWSKVVESLFELENGGLEEKLRESRKKLYPWTYDAGKKYFLS